MSHSHIEKYIERVVGKANDKEGHRGYLMFDYQWQRNMGDLHFNRQEFPDINGTMEMIRWENVGVLTSAYYDYETMTYVHRILLMVLGILKHPLGKT